MAASDIDLIILATATPDQTFPASATIVQHALGCNGGVAFDVAAVCSGFLYAFSVAESMIRAGSARNALVIGAETFSRILDWEDRTTCVLFGDGAGAVVLSGEGRAFCAGLDMQSFAAMKQDGDAVPGVRDQRLRDAAAPWVRPRGLQALARLARRSY